MVAPATSFELTEGASGMSQVLFRELALREGAFHLRTCEWATLLSRLPEDMGEPLASARTTWSDAEVLRRKGAVVHARISEGWVTVNLASADRAELDDLEAEFRGLIPAPPIVEQDDPHTTLRFWNRAVHGAQRRSRQVAVHAWPAIGQNYPARTRASLEELMCGWEPDGHGQLILWHGPPGTGKTNALRALTWQWRDWCDADYIVDPEVFLAERPDYMLEVLLDSTDNEGTPDGLEDGRRWRLLILEDSGELLSTDAKEQAGQGLSRLLNVVDGLIGQGLRVLILVTGNEPLRRLHPALSRPGRCASNIEFDGFSRAEAQTWLQESGSAAEVESGGTLAELFAVREGRGSPREFRLGFV